MVGLRVCTLVSLFLTVFQGWSWAEVIEVDSKNIKSLLESRSARVYAAKTEKQASEKRSGYWARSFFPTLELQGGQSRFRTGSREERTQPSYGAELSLNLYNGGRDQAEGQIRELDVAKRSYQLKRITAEELEKVRSSYWQLLYLRERQKILQTTLNLNKKNLSAALRRIRAGVATDSDRFEFEMKDIELSREVAVTRVLIDNQTRDLKIQLGVEDATSLHFPEAYQHDHEEIGGQQLEAQYEFLYREAEIESQQHHLSALKSQRAWQPSVEAFAVYNQFNRTIAMGEPDMTERERRETIVGLRVSMNLSAGFSERQEASALKQEALAVEAMARYQKRLADSEIKAELAMLKLLHDQVHEAEENIQRAEKYYNITQTSYIRGSKNSPDVLSAAEKLFSMRDKRLEIIRDFQVAKSHFISKLGQ